MKRIILPHAHCWPAATPFVLQYARTLGASTNITRRKQPFRTITRRFLATASMAAETCQGAAEISPLSRAATQGRQAEGTQSPPVRGAVLTGRELDRIHREYQQREAKIRAEYEAEKVERQRRAPYSNRVQKQAWCSDELRNEPGKPEREPAPEWFFLTNYSKHRMWHHDLPMWRQVCMQWGGLFWFFFWFGGSYLMRLKNDRDVLWDNDGDRRYRLSGVDY